MRIELARLGFLLTVLVASEAFAGAYFRNLRLDQTVPTHCQHTRLSHFPEVSSLRFISYTTQPERGGFPSRFSHEYPMDREESRPLWRAIRVHEPLDFFTVGTHLRELYELLYYNFEERDFTFKNEGEILELLASLELEKEFPTDVFFVTGGVVYHEAHATRVLGELDFLIGKRDDCEVTVVGEAKLNPNRIAKAREQIARFRSFLSRVQ